MIRALALALLLVMLSGGHASAIAGDCYADLRAALEATREFVDAQNPRWPVYSMSDSLVPRPHDPLVDAEATAKAAQWRVEVIRRQQAVARQAREVLDRCPRNGR